MNQISPDFVIAGAQKCGTSSLYFYLKQHPNILPAPGKELHFFSGGLNPNKDKFRNGLSWYQSQFPAKSDKLKDKTFEATPLYLFHPLAAERMARLIPQAKIIFLLRNPTERAISHYFHVQKTVSELYGIKEAMQKEDDLLDKLMRDQNYSSVDFRHHSYKKRGLYAEQLKRFFQHFSREQILILSMEKFVSAPDACLSRVFELVGVDTEFKIENKTPKNVSYNRTKIDSDVYDYLNQYFEQPNIELFDLIDERFDW